MAINDSPGCGVNPQWPSWRSRNRVGCNADETTRRVNYLVDIDTAKDLLVYPGQQYGYRRKTTHKTRLTSNMTLVIVVPRYGVPSVMTDLIKARWFPVAKYFECVSA
jgi:hypothetical protein